MVQRDVPPGIEVKVQHFLALTEWDKTFMCVLNVTGSMGTSTAKRVFLPATFFEATSHPLFALDKRTMPIDLDYPLAAQDTLSIKLPATFDIESLPKDAEVTFPQNAFYRAKYTRDPGQVKSLRLFVLGNSIYRAEEYPQLKDFYEKINAKDKEPAVLEFTQAASITGDAAAGKAQ
jgi:hypothetical protein